MVGPNDRIKLIGIQVHSGVEANEEADNLAKACPVAQPYLPILQSLSTDER